MIFVTSDEHFNHMNILGFCKRPYNSIKGMTRNFIDNHNSLVTDDDYVYHLGDFYTTNTSPNGLYFRKRELQIQDMKNILHQLHGQHILIKGNHDSFTDEDYIDFGFKKVHSEPYTFKYIVPRNTVGYNFTAVVPKSVHFVMCHDPALINMFGDHYLNYVFLCGHIHRLFRISEYPYKVLNVGVDVNDFKPISIESCINEFYKENNYGKSS